MASTAVEVSVDEAFISTAGGQRLLLMFVNLLARCFGHLSLAPGGGLASRTFVDPVIVARDLSVGETVTLLVHRVHGDMIAPGASRTVRLHVGPRPPRPWIPSVTARGWRGMLWPAYGAPDYWSGEPNVVGAAVGALLGAIAATHAFIEQVTQTPDQELGRPMTVPTEARTRYALALGHLELSALDLIEPGADETPWKPLDLGRVSFVSLGAVNGALLYMMRLAGDITAEVSVIEPQDLHRTDLNRYLYAVASGVYQPKGVIAEGLATQMLKITARTASVERVCSCLGPLTISGVDNNTARWEVQRKASRWLLSLETEREEARISVHCRSGGACLRCLHPALIEPDPAQPTHPVVSSWPALLALVLLGRGASGWRPGRQVRLNGLAPSAWGREVFGRSPACPGCQAAGPGAEKGGHSSRRDSGDEDVRSDA